MSGSPERDDGVWVELGLAAPARRALFNAGISTTDDLRRLSRDDLSRLHGIGPSALSALAPFTRESRLD